MNESHSSIDSADRRIALLLFLLFLGSFLYVKPWFIDHGPSNRVAFCLAILEDGSLKIDRYHRFSVDICIRDGHYYSDKAPGMSLLAFPVISAGYVAMKCLGVEDVAAYVVEDEEVVPCLYYKLLLLLGTIPSSFFSALGVSAFYCLGRRWGAKKGVALLVALLLGMGSPYNSYATLMFGHSVAAAFFIFALLWGSTTLEREKRRKEERGAGTAFRWLFVGFLLAYAVLTEYTAALPAIAVGMLFLGTLLTISHVRTAKAAGWMFLGAVPVALVFFAVNTICFGGPLKLGYQFVTTNFPQMNTGFYGINLPDFEYLGWMFFFKTGILWFSPFLLFSPIFYIRNIYLDRFRALHLVSVLIVAYYALMTSSYAYPHPRHFYAAMPFLILPFFFAWRDENTWMKTLLTVLAVLGILFSGAAFMAPKTPEYYASHLPVFYTFRELIEGQAGKNLGCYAGLSVTTSHLLLLFYWTVFGFLIRKSLRSAEPEPEKTIARLTPD